MTTLPILIPISEAARKYGLEEARLRQLVEKGKIRAGVVAGEMVVSEEEVQSKILARKEDLPEYKKNSHLKGVAIGFTEALDKYKVNLSTLYRWYKKGLIKEVKREKGLGGQKIFLDEADVAYCMEVYRKQGGQGKRIFDREGKPYKPKSEIVGF